MSQPTALSGPSFHLRTVRGSTKLVLFFGGIGARDGRFQYWKVGKALDAHCLFLSDGRKHWYQGGVPGLGDHLESTLDSIRRWAVVLGTDEIYAFGQSMGAHGAILYGARLGARVIAFGAETILRLESSRSMRMLAADAHIAHPDLLDAIIAAEKPILTFASEEDPIDLYCIDRVNGLPNCRARTITGYKHDLATHLHRADQLVPMLRTFVDNRPIPLLQNEGRALSHPGFAEAFYDLFRHVRAGRYDEAAAAGTFAVSLYPRSAYASYLTGKALFAMKQIGPARPHLENALTLAPSEPGYRFLMGRCLAQLREYDRAIAIFDGIIAERPDSAGAFHQIAGIRYRQGDLLQALAASRRAVALAPAIKVYATLRDKIEARLAVSPAQAAPALPDDPMQPDQTKLSGLYRSVVEVVSRRR